MFDQVFHYDHYTRELTAGPLSPFLDEIAVIYFERGHSRRRVRGKFVVLGHLSRWMRVRRIPVKGLSDGVISKFIRAQARRVVGPLSDRGDIESLKVLMRLLRGKGLVPVEREKLIPSERLLRAFEEHLLTVKGMTAPAASCYRRYAGLFLQDRFSDGRISWNGFDSSDVYRFILRISQRFTPGTNCLVVTSLRAFFRFLNFRGDLHWNVSKAIPSVPNWRATNLPYYLNARELEKLLSSVDKMTPLGKRDYAMLLFLARLGMRACEVVNLSIDDIDWTNGEIILCGKGVKRKRLPLTKEIGDALVSYLRVRRSNGKTRKVFIRSFPPYEGITTSLVSVTVRTALGRVGLKPYKSGSHLLRHTAATEMLRKGASLSEIGMVLGHQSVETTAIYAKVDFKAMRTIARPWPAMRGAR